MPSFLYQKIVNSTSHRESRDENSNFVLNNKELFEELLRYSLDPNDKNQHKFCWTLELVLERRLTLLYPYLDIFCKSISEIKNQSALRSISKICWILAKCKKLKPKHEQPIIENCFDILISDKAKVVPKVFSIYTLTEFSQKNEWVRDELKTIITTDYAQNSPAYKAATRKSLKKIDNYNRWGGFNSIL